LLIPNPIPKTVLHQKKGMKIYMGLKKIRKITKKNEDHPADKSEIEEIGQELEGESDQDGEEELDEEEVQEEDSSNAEEEEDHSEDAGKVKEDNKEEHESEDVEEPEAIFNQIVGLDNSMFGNLRLNNHALFTITNSLMKFCNKVRGKNNREIADAMSALSRKNGFVDALSELSKVT
jgi:hypothetical protein